MEKKKWQLLICVEKFSPEIFLFSERPIISFYGNGHAIGFMTEKTPECPSYYVETNASYILRQIVV